MTKIFKQLARHWAVCLVVFALLFVQAYCDLSLPDYTSKIVDTGIQQGGIESPLPDTVRQSTLDALSLLMREEDAAAFQNAYTADGDVLRLRTDLTADERTALEDAVTTPDIVLYLAAAQAANTPAGQTGMGMTGLADLQASGADRNPDTETETAAPTAEDLDTVCGQFAAMGQMPGSLQMQNIIPTQILGTALTAAPVEGVLATLFMIVVGVGYLYWQVKKGHDDPEAAIELYQVQGGILDEKELEQRAPGFWISLLPMVVTFVLINGFGVELLYGLTAGCVLSLLFFCKSLGGVKGFGEIVSEGFNNGIFPCIIIAAVVGVGKVVSATDVFALVQENIINLPLPGLVKVAAITTIIAGITGSASGGLTIALELFGETFISWGYTPEIIHRVASIACGGLDTLPWNGTVVMLFALSGVSYKKGYKHVAMETVILPLLSLIPVFIYYSIVH